MSQQQQALNNNASITPTTPQTPSKTWNTNNNTSTGPNATFILDYIECLRLSYQHTPFEKCIDLNKIPTKEVEQLDEVERQLFQARHESRKAELDFLHK